MEQNKVNRESALSWWLDINPKNKMKLMDKHFPTKSYIEISSSSSKIEEIYNLEHSIKHIKSEPVKLYTKEEVISLLDKQRIICISKYAHHTDLCEEDILNIPYPSEFKDLPQMMDRSKIY